MAGCTFGFFRGFPEDALGHMAGGTFGSSAASRARLSDGADDYGHDRIGQPMLPPRVHCIRGGLFAVMVLHVLVAVMQLASTVTSAAMAEDNVKKQFMEDYTFEQ